MYTSNIDVLKQNYDSSLPKTYDFLRPNAFKFSIKDDLDVISNHLINIFKNHKKFLKKSHSSRIYYEKMLDWNITGNKLKKIINKNC
jgi:hypothetical protein